MSSFFDEIAAKLAGLSGVATPEVSRDELNEFNVRDIQAVTVSEGGGGGGGNVPFVGVDPPASPTDGMLWWDPDDDTAGGGSQTVQWRGPYHVDYTDCPNVGDSVALFTPATGEVVLTTSVNPRTLVQFKNTGGSHEVDIGQASELDPGNTPPTYAWWKQDSDLLYGPVKQTLFGSSTTLLYPQSVLPWATSGIAIPEMFPLAEPVIFKYSYDGAGDPDPLIQGSGDFYFLIATAVAP